MGMPEMTTTPLATSMTVHRDSDSWQTHQSAASASDYGWEVEEESS